MPRAIWSGNISFGLVTVPVKLYSAISSQTVRFHQLHASDHVRIQQKRVCPADGRELGYEEIVKGYEIAPDQYVVIEPDELAALAPERSHTIEIEDFVEQSEIDPLYLDHPYYLLPGTGALKPYELLAAAMRQTGRVAVARVVIRNREQLVCIRPLERVLAMSTMNFADEVVSVDDFSEIPQESTELTDRELDIACQLVESMSNSFQPGRYHDAYREKVLQLIERKAAGQEVARTPQPVGAVTQTPDLMGALKQSLEQLASTSGAGAGRPKRRRARTAAAKPARPASRETARRRRARSSSAAGSTRRA